MKVQEGLVLSAVAGVWALAWAVVQEMAAGCVAVGRSSVGVVGNDTSEGNGAQQTWGHVLLAEEFGLFPASCSHHNTWRGRPEQCCPVHRWERCVLIHSTKWPYVTFNVLCSSTYRAEVWRSNPDRIQE